jgi:hypothetical protein
MQLGKEFRVKRGSLGTLATAVMLAVIGLTNS